MSFYFILPLCVQNCLLNTPILLLFKYYINCRWFMCLVFDLNIFHFISFSFHILKWNQVEPKWDILGNRGHFGQNHEKLFKNYKMNILVVKLYGDTGRQANFAGSRRSPPVPPLGETQNDNDFGLPCLKLTLK